jgi:hypothetical protein
MGEYGVAEGSAAIRCWKSEPASMQQYEKLNPKDYKAFLQLTPGF